jgi:hypothetical protein
MKRTVRDSNPEETIDVLPIAIVRKPLAHPLPKRLLPESRGEAVTRLRASLRRPPVFHPSLS